MGEKKGRKKGRRKGKNKEKNKETKKQRNKETKRQRDKETKRQRDKETNSPWPARVLVARLLLFWSNVRVTKAFVDSLKSFLEKVLVHTNKYENSLLPSRRSLSV